ncbi:type VII secretion-associated protein [Aldersonia kunmingensis]|uniref:type VII secretion-associated protein n=1 Tax=Aldersonia kunmingensis TaxID=408066 RepID=UPI0008376829|nr:type VII secretion-associated protein [Aldersonia kunmingensis]
MTAAALCVTADGVFGWVRRDGVTVDIVSGAGLNELAGRLAGARISASFPSHWAAPRRDRLAAELAAGGARVELTPIALAAASAVAGATVHGPRVVVVELERHAATVTCVAPAGDEVRIVACEREPALGAEDLLDPDRGLEAIAALAGLVEAIGAGRAVEEILVVAEADPATLEPFLVSLAKALPRIGRSRVLHPTQVCPPSTDEIPAVLPHRQVGLVGRGTAVALAALLVVGISTGVWWWQANGPRQPAAAAEATTVSTLGPAQPSEVTQVNGRVRFVVPPSWSPRPPDPQRPGRLELAPPGGAAARIIVIQNEIDPGLGYDEVASALADKIAARGSGGPFADLQRDVVFGGRPGLSYRETPSPGSEVRWHVVVEQEMQVSVGCQYPAADWALVIGACERVVRSLTVASG